MAINITWGTKTINIAKADMLLIQTVPSEIYQLDLDVLRLALKDLEDDSDGMAFERTHSHNAPVTVGGAVLAQVIEIINGYTVLFEDGTYRVTTVGANSNIGEVIQVNSVSVSTANSAGLQDLSSLQAASFGGEVTVDTTSSYSGTTFPIGTRGNPVNNLTDAHAIALSRGLYTFKIVSDLTLLEDDFGDGHIFSGDSATDVILTIDAESDVTKCTFRDITIQGTLDNGNIVRECYVLDIDAVDGFMHQCAFGGTITLNGTGGTVIMSCYSAVAGGDNTPVIDMGGSGSTLALRDFDGGLKIINRTGTDAVSLDFSSGQCIIDSTVTAGDITIRGIAKVTDNSTGTANVIDETISTTVKAGLTRNQFLALK